MKKFISRDLGLTTRDGQYITDRSEIDVITFSASAFTNPYIVPCDVESSKPLELNGEYDFFE